MGVMHAPGAAASQGNACRWISGEGDEKRGGGEETKVDNSTDQARDSAARL